MVSHQTSNQPQKIIININRDEKTHVARLLSFLLSGERVAHCCAAKQALLCNDKAMKHFLIRQSRQERFHALTFQSAILWLAPKGVNNPAKKQMQQYESILQESIKNKDLLNSIIGLQVILEGMGDIVLSHLNHGINQRGLGYQKIRKTILAQEDLHHEFGLKHVTTHKNTVRSSSDSANYLSLINDIFISFETLFEIFDENSSDYLAQFYQNLPVWMRNHALGYYPDI